MNYIYNEDKTLRTTLNRVHYTAVNIPPRGEMGWFALVECDDKTSLGDWSMTKVYCGVVAEMNNEQEIANIMHNGYKANSLFEWLKERV